MYSRFRELGVPVAITRDTDKTLSRTERTNTMSKTFGNGPNVIVLSNHINAGGGEGAEVVYPLRTSSTLPKAILDEIGSRGQIKRKIYQRVLPENPSKDYYYIMRDTPNTTTLLIEYGFIDNPRDQNKLQNNLLDYVEGVVKAVSEYIGVPYIGPGNSSPNNNNNINNNYYIVKKGDTLYSIALNNNVSVNELKSLNNLPNNSIIPGQELIIPNQEIINNNDNNNNNNSYTIQNGDTLYSIAQRYGVSVNDLIDYNNLSTTVLIPGSVLNIPSQEISENTYIVKRGDTLYSIARMYNVTLSELKNLNNLNSDNLSIGQELNIPQNIITETDYIVYRVEPGDTLYSIASKYNTNVASIKSYNNLNSDLLQIGDVLQIPLPVTETLYQTYTVQSGDTLYSIARRFNKPLDSILSLNSDLNTILQIGDVIKIPNE